MAVLTLLHFLSCIPFFFLGRGYPFAPFNLNSEQNIPTFFAVALLVCSSVLTLIIACNQRTNKAMRWKWRGLSAAFLATGFDEFSELHERLIYPVRDWLGTSGLFYYAWVVPYLLLLIIFLMIYAKFFFQLPKDTRNKVLLASCLYIGGAIGMEMIGGAWKEAFGRVPVYYLIASLEEIMELAGCIIFIQAFSNHIDKYLPDLRLRITSS